MDQPKGATLTDLEQLERFFYRAMQQGWASGAPGKPVRGMPDHVRYRCYWKSLRLVDTRSVPSSGYRMMGQIGVFQACGSTWRLVWGLQYNGFCPDDVSSMLRQGLFRAYRDEKFFGKETCRVAGEGMTFVSEISGGFGRFSGSGKVLLTGEAAKARTAASGSLLSASLTYSGGLLVPSL